MIVNSLMSLAILNLQDPASRGGGTATTAMYIGLAVVVVIAAGYFLLRKRK